MTRAAFAWLWDRKSRIIAPEVGLTKGHGRLTEPWSSWYRVDLAAALRRETHIIEVKGTRADIAREDLGSGKWSQPFPDIRPWLAFDEKITEELYEALDERRGLLQVSETRVRVLRNAHEVRDDRQAESLRILAQVLCWHKLPTMMGKNRAQKMAALGDVSRPWRYWLEEDTTTIEEPGNIL